MEPTDTNLRAWEEAHKRIRRSSARGSRTLPKPVRERLPDIAGRHVLHLACGAGRETAALMSLGGLVTGVDSSEKTVVAARKRLPDAALVTASPEALPVELRRGRAQRLQHEAHVGRRQREGGLQHGHPLLEPVFVDALEALDVHQPAADLHGGIAVGREQVEVVALLDPVRCERVEAALGRPEALAEGAPLPARDESGHVWHAASVPCR